MFPPMHPRSQQLGPTHTNPLQQPPKGSRSSYQAIHLVDCCLDVRYNDERFASHPVRLPTIRSTSCCSGHYVCTAVRDLRKQSFALCAIPGTTRWIPITAFPSIACVRSLKKNFRIPLQILQTPRCAVELPMRSLSNATSERRLQHVVCVVAIQKGHRRTYLPFNTDYPHAPKNTENLAAFLDCHAAHPDLARTRSKRFHR